MTLAWTDDKLSSRQAQNDVKFDFQVKFDLEDQSRSPHKTKRDLNQGVLHLCSKFGDSSLNGWRVIARQTRDWHTDRQTLTHTQMQATTIPEGQRWPRVKTDQWNKWKNQNSGWHKLESTTCFVPILIMRIEEVACYMLAMSRRQYKSTSIRNLKKMYSQV